MNERKDHNRPFLSMSENVFHYSHQWQYNMWSWCTGFCAYLHAEASEMLHQRTGSSKKIQYGHWRVVVFWLKIALSFTMSVSHMHTPVILILQKKLTQWQSSACIQPWNILQSREIHMLWDQPVKAKPQSSTATKRQTGREVCQHYPLTFFIKPHNLPAFSTLLSSLF